MLTLITILEKIYFKLQAQVDKWFTTMVKEKLERFQPRPLYLLPLYFFIPRVKELFLTLNLIFLTPSPLLCNYLPTPPPSPPPVHSNPAPHGTELKVFIRVVFAPVFLQVLGRTHLFVSVLNVRTNFGPSRS